MSHDRLFLGCVFAVGLGLASGPASALIAPAGTLDINGYLEKVGAVAVPSTDATGTLSWGPAFVTLETSPGAAVLAYTPSVGAHGAAYGAFGQISYSAEVDGPLAGVTVPLRLYYALSAKGDDAGSRVNAGVTFGGLVHLVALHDGMPAVDESGSLLQDGTTGTPLQISIIADSLSGGTAYVDPLLTLDPTWAAANPALAAQLSISVGGGAQNGLGTLSSSAAEPGSWAMMLLGVGLVGGVLRRRTSPAVPA